MEKISQWCKMISLFSVLSSVVMLVLPEGGCKKGVKILLSVLMVYCIVSPFAGVTEEVFEEYFSDKSHFADESADIKEYENYAVLLAAESETEKYITDFMKASGVIADCEVKCIYEDEGVKIEEVSISGNIKSEDKDNIISEIHKIAGEEVIIKFKGAKDEE